MDDVTLGGGKISFTQRLALRALNLIPLGGRIRLFERLALLFYFLDVRHRRIALRNLTLAFPEQGKEKLSLMARVTFRNLGRVLAEFTYVPRLRRDTLDRFISYKGLDHFFQAQQKGKGVLVLTAHFGNWEWMAAAFPMVSQCPCHVIVRPLDNPWLDGLVEGLRTWTGNRIVAKQKSMTRVLRLLKKGETVGVLLDQNVAWQEGVFVKFFGELACTNAGLALLAMKSGASVIPAFCIREKDGRYEVRFEPEIPWVHTGKKSTDVAINTERYTAMIERYARNYPDHWFWPHQRWKTRPWQVNRNEKLEQMRDADSEKSLEGT